MSQFTPWASLAGGLFLGVSALMLLLFSGRIAGMSGIFGGLLHFRPGDTAWRVIFLLGLLAGGALLALMFPSSLDIDVEFSAPVIMLAGLMVGIGSRMGSGCTSGHGICGIGRLSPRSIAAVAVFMSTGILTATLIANLFGGQL